MLKDQNILCISSIDWDFIWQGHQQIMSMLAANGNKVLFVENTGVRRLEGRAARYYPGFTRDSLGKILVLSITS